MAETLAERVAKRGARPWRETLRIVWGVSRALGQEHLRKRGHGGLYPAAVTCLPGEGARELRIALPPKPVRRACPLARQAPELWFSSRTPATPATDVWALGLIAYYALTGHVLWSSARSSGACNVVGLAEEVSRPPRASLRAEEQGVRSKVPPGFDTWLAQCLEGIPANRFPSAPRAYRALFELEARHLSTARRRSTFGDEFADATSR